MYFSKDKISENQKILEVDINDDDAEELEEDDFIDLSKGRNSLGLIEKELDKLLNG